MITTHPRISTGTTTTTYSFNTPSYSIVELGRVNDPNTIRVSLLKTNNAELISTYVGRNEAGKKVLYGVYKSKVNTSYPSPPYTPTYPLPYTVTTPTCSCSCHKTWGGTMMHTQGHSCCNDGKEYTGGPTINKNQGFLPTPDLNQTRFA